jgi:chemotaxis protein CheX
LENLQNNWEELMEKYIQPFIDVSKHVFKELVNIDLEAERPYFSDSGSISEWDISGFIGLSGEARGAVIISMKNKLALQLTTILTGKEHTTIDDSVVDAVGEIITIIAGNVKQNLEQVFKLVISLPTVVNGGGHSIKWPHSRSRTICIPFKPSGEANGFCLSVALDTGREEG